ncbi:MAG: DNA mismatch repair endonuclease MutL [Candidatus Thermoplasmatota archaeon]|nr:DNA mismatch repair endonuclease MutL [Candidatus Thermoplasmatota archaeon]
MQKIKILDSETISKIAAGEVIERPASVVKELVENALDAGASKIYIEVEDAGLKKILVRDDGCGMSREDAKLAFERHSTSKLEKIEDLEKLETLGFRGEALPSIASVSFTEMVTKTQECEVGTYIAVEYGKPKETKDIGSPVGTTVTVKNLFYNVPVRRKFLKSRRIELSHIIDVVTRYALIHYHKTFKLVSNNEELLFSPSSKSMLETITAIYGKEYGRALIPLSYKTETIAISGYISKPSLTRATPSHQSIYVNRRYITSRIVSDAIKDAYFRLVTKDRYPVAVVAIKIDPKLVDVNIHPTKSQLKFSNEIEIYGSVVACVREALSHEKLIPEPKREEIKLISEIYKAPELKPLPHLPKEGVKLIKPQYLQEERITVLKEGRKLPELRIVGQALDSFIVAEARNAILVIDQHAAHERIMLEKLKAQSENIEIQELLEPLVLELNPKEEFVLRNNLGIFEELGFKIENFGRAMYKLSTVPILLGKLKKKEDFVDVIDELASAGKLEAGEGTRRKLIELLACKSAIKANEKLGIQEIEKLIKELGSLEEPYTCAHGRPTIIELSRKELDRMFKRT